MSQYWYQIESNEDGSERSVTFDGTTYTTGQRYETDNVCDMVRFIRALPTSAREMQAGFLQSVEEDSALPENNCPISFASDGSIVAQPAATVPPSDVDTSQSGDDAGLQGAPNPHVTATVGGDASGGNDGGTNPPPTEEDRRPPSGDPDRTHGGEHAQEQTNAGDPVDLFSGAFYLEETDLEIPNTILPLQFKRLYKSGSPYFGPFGWNWDHNLNLYLRELNTGNVALWRNLHEETFTFDGVQFEPQRGIFEKLEPSGAPQSYDLLKAGGVTMHFEFPQGWTDAERIPLVEIKDRHGNALALRYDTENRLAEVRDVDDRFFTFGYDACGLLVEVSDHSGRKFLYGHDEETMQLVQVTTPPTSDHPAGIKRVYQYEDPWTLPQLRHNITRVEDGNGNVYLQNTYDEDPASISFSRVTEQLYGDYLFQFQYTQLQWVPPNIIYVNTPALRVEVMNPDYGLETYTFNYRGDLLDRRYRLVKDKSYRVVVWQYEFDDQGNLSKSTRPDGSEELQVFDFANADPRMRGNLLRKELTAAAGFPAASRIVWRGSYEATYQQLKEERDEQGSKTTYRYDFDLTPASATNTGKLMEVIQPDTTLPDGTTQTSTIRYEYNAKGQRTAAILADGTRNEIEYGTAGNGKSRMTRQIFDTAGLALEEKVSYDATGYGKSKTDPNGNVTTYFFNALGLLEKIILPPVNGTSAEQRFHYDRDKKLVRLERPKGDYSDPALSGNFIYDDYHRDVLGYPVELILSSNTSEARSFQAVNNYRGTAERIQNPDGSLLKKTYDERGLLIQTELEGTDGQTVRSKKTYDRSGKTVQQTNEFGLVTRYTHDGFARPVKTTLPNGTEIINTWGPGDVLLSEETIGDDGSGVRRQLALKSYTYDEKNRKVTETVKVFTSNPALSSNATQTFYYDVLNRPIKVINERGGVSLIHYDNVGRKIKEVDPLGNEEHYFYDGNANLVKTESHHLEPGGATSIYTRRYGYDSRNRKIQLQEPDGATITSAYDDRNVLVQLSDQMGSTKQMFYDSFGTKIREIRDAGGLALTQQWNLNEMGQVTGYIDPMGEVSHYLYDSVGRNIRTDYPNGFINRKTYNSANQLTEEELGSGVILSYEYDAAGRLSKIKNPLAPAPLRPTPDYLFTYDGMDRLTTAKAGTKLTARSYDSRGRMLEEKTNGVLLSCSYDDAAGTVEKKWPDGRTEKLSHDLNGVLTKLEEPAHGSLGSGNSFIAGFTPSGPRFLGESQLAGGTTVANSYDQRKRLTGITITNTPSGLAEGIHYRYNSCNIRQVESLSGTNPVISYYEYDSQYRLLDAWNGFAVSLGAVSTQSDHDTVIQAVKLASAGSTRSEHFLYNASDARTRYTETGVPVRNYAYLPGHRIQSDGINTYAFLPDGTMRSDGALDYEGDALGRVVAVRSGGTLITEIEYDALGRPDLLKVSGKPNRSFHYFGGFIEQENENGGAVRQVSIHPVSGVPIAYHTAGVTRFAVFDTRFNLVGLLSDTGTLLESYRYKSFGEPGIFTPSGAALTASAYGIDPIFGGQRFLSSCRHYLSKRRLMDPANGVYLSPDPKSFHDSSSLYVYAAQDPVNNIDPNGDIIPFIIAAFVIGGALAGAGYSAYDAYYHPESYEGWSGGLHVLGNVFGGALIGGGGALIGEAVLGIGGVGMFATGTTTATLTYTQAFVLFGTSSAFTGYFLRSGFNNMFPQYVNPPSAGTMAFDYATGGVFGWAFKGLGMIPPPGGPGGGGPNATWTLQGDREAILNSRRIWGQTEGSVYGMDTPNLPTWRATGGGKVGPDSAIFEFEGANNIFQPHEVTGPFSLIKRLLGQSKAGFGDIAFEGAVQTGTRTVNGVEIPIYRLDGVRLLEGEFAGQSARFAAARLWGRRTLDGLLGAGLLAALGLNGYNYAESNSSDQSHPNAKPTGSK